MITMLDVEIRRCLSRRLVRWLIAIALLGCALTAFFVRREAEPAGHPNEFRLEDLWVPGGDPLIGPGAIFLLIGAVLGLAALVLYFHPFYMVAIVIDVVIVALVWGRVVAAR